MGCCDFVPELNHSVAWPEILYGIDSLFGGVLTLTQRVMLPFTVHVYLAYIRLFADGTLARNFKKVQREHFLRLGNLHELHVQIPYMALRRGNPSPDGQTQRVHMYVYWMAEGGVKVKL